LGTKIPETLLKIRVYQTVVERRGNYSVTDRQIMGKIKEKKAVRGEAERL